MLTIVSYKTVDWDELEGTFFLSIYTHGRNLAENGDFVDGSQHFIGHFTLRQLKKWRAGNHVAQKSFP